MEESIVLKEGVTSDPIGRGSMKNEGNASTETNQHVSQTMTTENVAKSEETNLIQDGTISRQKPTAQYGETEQEDSTPKDKSKNLMLQKEGTASDPVGRKRSMKNKGNASTEINQHVSDTINSENVAKSGETNLIHDGTISRQKPTAQDDETEQLDDLTPQDKSKKVMLQKELGLFDCVCIIVGNIVGSGIFASPRAVLQYTGSVGMSLVIWVATGIVAMCGAVSFAELGTMIPQSGGNYTYLYEAFGPLPAFLYIWMYVSVVIPSSTMIPQSGGNYTYLYEAFGPLPAFLYIWMYVSIVIPSSRALGALTFANYITQPLFPVGQDPPESAITMLAIMLLLLLTYINTRAVKWATILQDGLALLKIFALLVIIVVGIYYLVTGNTKNYQYPFKGTNWDITLLATAFYHTTYAYEGWDNLNNITEEIKNPEKNLPRSIGISLILVTIIYTLTNISFFAVLDNDQMLASVAVAVTFGKLALGVIAWTVPIFVSCSTAGAINGAILTHSRVIYASARRSHLPRVFSFVHMNNNTPVTALALLAGVSLLMFVSSDLMTIANYYGFANNLMGLLCISSIFYFRIKRPELHRPVKVWIGFPTIFTIVSIFLVIFPLIQRPTETIAALVVILTGLPIYYFAIHREEKPQTINTIMDKLTYCIQMIFLSVPEEREEQEKTKL